MPTPTSQGKGLGWIPRLAAYGVGVAGQLVLVLLDWNSPLRFREQSLYGHIGVWLTMAIVAAMVTPFLVARRPFRTGMLLTVGVSAVFLVVSHVQVRVVFGPNTSLVTFPLLLVSLVLVNLAVATWFLGWGERGRAPSGPRTTRTALTLVEVLVATVIVALLSGLVTSVYRHGIREAEATTTVSNLRQVGTALGLYGGDEVPGLPPNLDPLVTTGLISDPAVLRSPGDPFPSGFGLTCERRAWRSPAKVPTSFESLRMFTRYLTWEKLVAWDPNMGVVVSRVHGRRSSDFADLLRDGPNIPKKADESPCFAFMGRVARLRLDGSVSWGRFESVRTPRGVTTHFGRRFSDSWPLDETLYLDK